MNISIEPVAKSWPLNALLRGFTDAAGSDETRIDSLCVDSRAVRPGSLFFAVPGSGDDGRNYIDEALNAGAAAVLYHSDDQNTVSSEDARVYGLPNLKKSVSTIASRFYDEPSKQRLHVVGITGTNGKTTCAWLCASALEAIGRKCGIIGTLGTGTIDNLNYSRLTTPDPVAVQSDLSHLADENTSFACLEASSHALDQSRVSGVNFATVVFTNLTHDHLDYHCSKEHYSASKAKLFTHFAPKTAVLNIDDHFGVTLSRCTNASRQITYGTRRGDVQLLDVEPSHNGLQVKLLVGKEELVINNRLIGRLNAINIAATVAVLVALDIDFADIEVATASLTPVPGRLEPMHESSSIGPKVYVDYAHTPDGLESALTSLGEITCGKLWCVFGCGGSRDAEKRPLMGAIAEQLADNVIVTDDNPRAETPQQIVQQILAGMKSTPLVEHNRRTAIYQAISNAKPADTLLIAGKGHETQQIYATSVKHFSDREIAKQALRSQK